MLDKLYEDKIMWIFLTYVLLLIQYKTLKSCVNNCYLSEKLILKYNINVKSKYIR